LDLSAEEIAALDAAERFTDLGARWERFADEPDDRDETPVEWGPLIAERWNFDNDPSERER
jgi:hypothetical protein